MREYRCFYAEIATTYPHGNIIISDTPGPKERVTECFPNG